MKILLPILLSFILLVFSILPANCENKFNVNILLTGDWGTKEGEFGIDRTGKTELGYALDLMILNDETYILDSTNNRVQKFDRTGKIDKIINLNKEWQKFGLPWDFTYFQGYFYILIGKAPYYSPTGIREINQFSQDGMFIKSFGGKQIPKNKEEYFDKIISDATNGYIYCGLGSTQVLRYEKDGNFKDAIAIARKGEIVNLVGMTPDGKPMLTMSKSSEYGTHTLIINPITKIIEEDIKGNYSLTNGKGIFVNVNTISGSKRKKTAMTTIVEVFDSIKNKINKTELKGDVVADKYGKNKVIKYSGRFLERSKIDTDGNIYHLIALDDGVVLRKITLK